MFIESKKSYAIFKAIESAAQKDDVDNFTAVTHRGDVSVSFDIGFGPYVFAENVEAICKRNGLDCDVVDGGDGYGGLHYRITITK